MYGTIVAQIDVPEGLEHAGKKKAKKDADIKAYTRNKKATTMVEKSFRRFGEDKRADRMRDCGDYLKFVTPSGEERRLYRANFCRERLCLNCNAIRAKMMTAKAFKMADDILKDAPTLVPLLLTVTLKNCIEEELESEISVYLNAFKKLVQRKTVKRVVVGWFRSLELTYNREEDTYHPHIHVLLLVNQSYFNGNYYLSHNDWAQLWKNCTGADYDPIVDIRRGKAKTKGKNPLKSVIVEVIKYVVKPADILELNYAQIDRYVPTVSKALKGRRLYAAGGILKAKAKTATEQLKTESDENKMKLREDLGALYEMFNWQRNEGGKYKYELTHSETGLERRDREIKKLELEHRNRTELKQR